MYNEIFKEKKYMMHETYSQIFRDVCIVFMYVCVCVHTETDMGRRQRKRQKQRARKERDGT